MNQSLYKDALTSAMTELGKMDNTIFIGQQLLWHGNPMSTTVSNVPKEKMIEIKDLLLRRISNSNPKKIFYYYLMKWMSLG